MIHVETLPLGPLETNCYLVYREGSSQCLAIDPGAEGAGIAEKLRRANLHLAAIALTHGHFDHIMGVQGVKKEYDIPIYASKDEVEVLAEPQINVSTMMGAYLSMKADELFSDGDVLELDQRRYPV